MKIFKRRYYLVFAKPVGRVNGQAPVYAVQVMYRKEKKFYLTHQLHTDNLMYWWQAKFWFLLFLVLGKKSNRLFAYRKTNGFVFMKKYC